MAHIAFGRMMRAVALWAALFVLALMTPFGALLAAPQASHVMDARTGETLFESNAHTPLHPASLTKMLTLYIAFEEIQRGNLSLDSMITVSKNAAAQPPSRLGLKAGQKIQLRFLIRAAAIKSANDAAQAIGDAIGGTQADFALRMTRTAKSLGMHNSTFKNANGLTAKGHLSTAYDMSVMGRRLFYDFPQYYNIFSRRQTSAGIADVANTNRKFLDAYKGADGIKTGFTQAAGFNLTASAERRNVRIIATVFGGESTADRNAKVAKLLDRGFAKARGNVGVVPPPPPVYENADNELLANAVTPDGLPEGGAGSAAKTVRAIMTVQKSPLPMPRPNFSEMASVAEDLVAGMAGGIAGALAEATGIEQAAVDIAAADIAAVDMAAVAAVQNAGLDASQPLPFAIAPPQDSTLTADLAPPDLAPPPAHMPRPAPRPAARVENAAVMHDTA
ncbi:MAG: D-alanyl-D-alanine carboxypeptidase family protein, partial [Cypionkella sp.]